ncbi:MAG TPA: Stp1/IreP family PP2C-type Ser/Thr phosphatase [Anaeromyxobacteraceae bacterium]|nr:Stp1/IreP family PP2C-type Ser/Thr phosphatase [Anaeromyxobacteraceae bacterium]
MNIAASGLTDTGRKRDHNEDSFLIDEGLRLFVVADGMGGHAGGGTASRLAVETIRDRLRGARQASPEVFGDSAEPEEGKLLEFLRQAVEAACAAIFKTAQGDPSLAGMGTTVTAALIDGETAYLAHVGDSRCYLLREGKIYQISEDHSLVNEQLKAGAITTDEARHSRFKNIITRSVGFEQEVLVDMMGLEVEPGDKMVLCCDGLSNLVQDHEILKIVDETPLEETPGKLVELANDRGGDDNITVIVVHTRE